MFNFQQSHFNQQEFDQLAELLLKYTIVYATPNFDVGKKIFNITIYSQT